MAKSKFYVVWVGRKPGVYRSWAECAAQVNGFPGAKFKSFDNDQQAREALRAGWQAYIGKPALPTLPPEVIADSLSVDAACEGNPGNLEYRGVYTATGEEVFHAGPIENGTNNLGEFLAIVQALQLLQQQGQTIPVYSDSRTALGWVSEKRVRSTLPRTRQTEKVWSLVDQALAWLKNNTYPNRLIEWQTEKWGQIRADFGRK